jgi:hypothetical protein
MLTIEWITNRGRDGPPEVVERVMFCGDVLSEALAFAKMYFPKVKESRPDSPPDGFRILDKSGREVAALFDPTFLHACD